MPNLLTSLRILFSRPRPVRFLLARMLSKSGLSKYLKIRRDGYELRFFPTSLSSALWELGPDERRDEELLIRRLLHSGDNYVDVGANIGALAIVGSQAVGPEGTVVAIEAHPGIFGFLQENLRLNRISAEVHNCAVGEEDGELRFSDTSQDDQNKVVNSSDAGIAVPVRRLDALVPNGSSIRLLKVDVEGFELPVFRGAAKVLGRTEIILFECWERHAARYAYTPADVLALLGSRGFRVYHENGSEVTSGERFPDCVNLVAVGENCRDPQQVLGLLR